MKLLSTIELYGFLYYVVLSDLKGGQEWYLVSKIHPKNYTKVGKEREENCLTFADLTKGGYEDYIVEGIKRSKKTGKIKVLDTTRMAGTLNKILDSYSDARDISYPKSCIDTNSVVDGLERRESFSASYEDYHIYYEKTDGVYDRLEFSTSSMNLTFSVNNKIRIPKKLNFIESKRTSKSLAVASLPTIDVESLGNVLDLSWYLDLTTKKRKKDYKSISNIVEFESLLVTPMIRNMTKEIAMGVRPLTSCDTETNGFNLLNLDVDNPDRSWISTIQFSWKEDQGVIVFLDMEYFDNVDKAYVMNRFKELYDYSVRTPKSSITLIYDEDGTKLSTPEVHNFERKSYDLVGHNTIFDSRVTLSEGAQYYFNHDTLQMAFNIDPTVTKGAKKLKRLTRYFFKHETPELAELLGKGNEDKFRFLKDREITEIYGCADTDYTRKLFFELRKLMDDLMYKSYCNIDPITWYLCAQSEFYGMRLEQKGLAEGTERIKKDLDMLKSVIFSYVGFVLQKRADLSLKGSNVFTSDSQEDLEGDEDFLNSTKQNKYEFKLKGTEVRKVMYNLLKYPIKVRTKKGLAAVDTDAFQKLMYYTNEIPVNLMKEDLISSDGETVLIEAKKFNSYKYPLCYLLKAYSTWDKEYTTYYKGFEREDLEGRLFKGVSTTNIETRRMSSPAQIIKKSLKKLILAHSEDHYLGDWDFDQVEARVFTSDANDVVGIAKYIDPEKDYHTENAALMNGMEAYQISKAIRDLAKAVGFGIPYGLSLYKLVERLFTVHSRENDLKTSDLMAKFEHVQKVCMTYLNEIRDKAVDPIEVPVELKRFWGMSDDSKVGMIKNKHGFYRYFNLDDVLGDERKEQSKRRQAGNFTIQSFAADLYKFALKRLYNRLVREGLDDKVIFHMYIHDELLFSVHKSIDPRRIAKICAEECMFRLKGHTSYFIGLAFGDSWLDCKKDPNEMPAKLLNEVSENYDSYADINEWTDNAKDFMRPIIDNYKVSRVMSVLKEIQPSFPEEPLNAVELEHGFTNYTVRSYAYESGKSYEPRKNLNNENKEVDDELDRLISCVCNLLNKQNLGNYRLNVDGKICTVSDYINSRIPVVKRKEVNTELKESMIDFFDDLENSDSGYWSFDDEDNSNLEEHVTNMYDYDDGEDWSFELPKHSHKYVRKAGHDVVLNCLRPKNVKLLSELVKKYKSPSGKKIVIETLVGTEMLPGKYDINFDTVDEFLKGVN